MNKEYRQYVERWKRVNALEIEELRRLTPNERVRQFFSLLELAKKMNWQSSTPVEIEEVRRRWRKLKGCGEYAETNSKQEAGLALADRRARRKKQWKA